MICKSETGPWASGMADTPKTIAGEGERLPKDGGGERDRAGVDVEKVKSGPWCNDLCLVWVIDRNSSDDLVGNLGLQSQYSG